MTLPVKERMKNRIVGGFMKTIDTEPGWDSILDNLDTKLTALLGDYGIYQVKQKFGGLRVYLEYHNEEAEKLIREAEQKALVTCELCGAPGELRTIGHYMTVRCDKHNTRVWPNEAI